MHKFPIIAAVLFALIATGCGARSANTVFETAPWLEGSWFMPNERTREFAVSAVFTRFGNEAMYAWETAPDRGSPKRGRGTFSLSEGEGNKITLAIKPDTGRGTTMKASFDGEKVTFFGAYCFPSGTYLNQMTASKIMQEWGQEKIKERRQAEAKQKAEAEVQQAKLKKFVESLDGEDKNLWIRAEANDTTVFARRAIEMKKAGSNRTEIDVAIEAMIEEVRGGLFGEDAIMSAAPRASDGAIWASSVQATQRKRQNWMRHFKSWLQTVPE